MYLIVTKEGTPLHVMPMSDGVLAVGRDVHNGLTLDDQAVSPRQIEIQVQGGLATVNSIAGTPGFVYQGKPHYQVVLPEGHEVQVGPYELRVETSPPTSPEAAKDVRVAQNTPESEGGAAAGGGWDEDIFGAALGDLFEEEDDAATDAMNSGAALGWAPEPDPVAMPWSAEELAMAETVPLDGVSALKESALEAEALRLADLQESSPQESTPEERAPKVAEETNIHLAETQPLKGLTTTPRTPPADLTPPQDDDALEMPDALAPLTKSALKQSSPAPETSPSAPEAAPQARAKAVTQAAPWEDVSPLQGPHLVPGEGTMAPLKLKDGTAFIGSAEGMDLVLKDPTVARRHGAVIYKDGKVRIQDMTGNRTIQVNGRGIQSRVLKDGDRIRVGLSELRFMWAGQPASALAEEEAGGALEDDHDGAPSGSKVSKGAIVGLVALAGLLGLGVSVVPKMLEPTPGAVEQNLAPDPAQVRVARALLDGGRISSAEDVIAGMPQGSGEAVALRRRSEEARAADDLAFSLWLETVAQANSKKDWAAVRRAEGADYLARAEGAFGRGAPSEIVAFWIEQSSLAFEDAKRLNPRSEETEEGLESARRLQGRLEVQGDSLEQRLKTERLNLLIERGRTQAQAGQFIDAARTLGHVVARGKVEGADPEFMAEAEAALASAKAQEADTLAPLFEGARVAVETGRLLDGKALYQGVLWLKPGDPIATQALADMEPALAELGARALAEADVALKAGKSEAAREKLRQVLGYVPDRSEALHREALKKLEAMAGAS